LVSRAGLAGGGAQNQDSYRPPSTDPLSVDIKGGQYKVFLLLFLQKKKTFRSSSLQ
jgi:hypothetical protein